MSFDDLPPGSEPPHTDEDVASSAAQAPSGQDAPPAAVARRRRAKPAGTVAASSPVIAESAPEKPKRKASTRQKPDPQPVSHIVAETVNKAPDAADTLPPQAEVSAKPPRKSASRTARLPAAVPSEPPISAVAPSETTAYSDSTDIVARTPGRRRRAGAKNPVAAAPDQVSEAPPELPSLPVAPGRSRRKRAAVIVPIAPGDVSSPAESPPAEQSQPVLETTVPGRRRTRTRGRRPAPVAGETPVLPTLGEEQTTEPPLAETDTAAPARPRRRRSRRSASRPETDISLPAADADSEPIEDEDVYTVPDIDRSVGAHLISRNGMPEIHIDGMVYPPVLFFGNIEEDNKENNNGGTCREKVRSEVRLAAEAGVHIHSTIIELPCPVSEISPAFPIAADRIQCLLAEDPAGYIIPRVVFVPARGWKRDNPADVAIYADGTTGDPSIASDRYWREAERSLQLLISYVSRQDWGTRVAGYHLERGEWFQPMSQGYDRCPTNRDSFREWLKSKYHNNVTLLRAAWYDGEVQFTTAEIPALQTKPNPQRAFFEPRRERSTIDYNEYASEITARRLVALATTAKRAAEHRVLISVCYGYTFEFGHPFSGHLALGTLEASHAVDLICGPPSYRDRIPGGGASLPAPIDSAPLHGKLWLSEDDTKTFLALPQQDPEDFNIRLESRHATDQAQQRAIGRTVAHATGIGFMDLWGEGWLDDTAMWQQVATFVSRFTEQIRIRQQPRVPQVVAIIDEKSLLHVQRGEQFLRRITAGARDSLQRAGVSFGIYLQSDLLSDAFPSEAKLYLFLTPYRLTTEQRIAVKEKLQRDGKTLAWLYAPGSCEERPSVGGALEETATGSVGIAIRQQEWNSEVGSRVVDSHHAVTDRLLSRDIGPRERLNPSFYVDDPEATVLAEYHGTGVPSIAVKNCGTWKSVFVGDPVLPVDLLRGICRFAGVHVWTPLGDDVIDIGNGYVTIHAAKEGQRAIRLPDATGLYDVTESRHIAEEIKEHRFFMRVGDTRSFCVGTSERFVSIGLPNVAPPGPSRPQSPYVGVPVQPYEPDTANDRDARLPRPRNSDIETLEAVLNMDISDLNGIDLEPVPEEPIEFIYVEGAVRAPQAPGVPDITGEVIAGGRRRRRRGGRGRGRRRTGDGSEEGAVGPDSGTTVASEKRSEEQGFPSESGNLAAGYSEVRNSLAEKSVWASEYETEMESPHADSGASAHSEGDAGL